MSKGYTVERFANKTDWLAHRSNGIGGSSAGTILGVNHWQTKLELYSSIVNPPKIYEYKEKKPTESIRVGVESEDLIRQTFAVMFPNLEVIPPNGFEMFKSVKYPFLLATVDGRLREKTGKKRLGILEIKTCSICNKKDYDEWFEFDNRLKRNVIKEIKQQYFAQVCHYFNVLDDTKFAYVVVQFTFYDWKANQDNKIEHLETHFIPIEKSEVADSCKNLLKIEKQFWEDCKNHKPPITKIKL